MTALSLSPQFVTYVNEIEGQTVDDKLKLLLETYLVAQIRACTQEIREYEVKYGSTFTTFALNWEQDNIPNKHSFTVERDYMEWEGLVAEKEHWLERLRDLSR